MKIAFFDIDGTLIDFGAPGVSEKVTKALNQLHDNGVKLFLATGRPPYLLPKFENIPFDGAICFNGSYVYNRDEVIYSSPMSEKDVETIVANAEKMNTPVIIAAEKRMGANAYSDALNEYMDISHNTCNVVDYFEELKHENVYQLMAGIHAEDDANILAGTQAAATTRWWSEACDIIPANISKAQGIQKVLDYYHISKEDAMAFGDGGNDLEMIEFVGLGIALGNALKHVQECADYVTDTCANDGIYTALKHFSFI